MGRGVIASKTPGGDGAGLPTFTLPQPVVNTILLQSLRTEFDLFTMNNREDINIYFNKLCDYQ